MEKLIIKNGLVYDPKNSIDGEVKDVLIEDGKIVEQFSNQSDIMEIDATNKTVVPAAIDIHSHFASLPLNWTRLLGKRSSLFHSTWNGFTLQKIVKDYVKKGYTFLVEASTFPSLAKGTMLNFKQMPILDKAMLLNVSNLFALELEFQREMVPETSVFLSDLLSKTKGFGLKIYNPFEGEEWNLNELRDTLDVNGRLYNFSPLDVYEKIAKANEYLKLPHSVHAHVEGYEDPQGKKNLEAIMSRMTEVSLKSDREGRDQAIHLAHGSTYNVDGNNENLINQLNSSKRFDLDLGFITFEKISPLITGDKRLFNRYWTDPSKNAPHKIISSAVEFEGDFFATLRSLRKNDKAACLMWANAIDLALNIQNKWQVQLSLNYPNHGNITQIADVATWLMSSEARKAFISELTKEIAYEEIIPNFDSQLSFNDFIIISRASPAKSLGIERMKGHLGTGADADVNILDINLSEIDPSKDHVSLKQALDDVNQVIKGGMVVKKQDAIDMNARGQILWSEGSIDESINKTSIMNKKKEFYTKYYSIFYDSLKTSIDNKYLRKID